MIDNLAIFGGSPAVLDKSKHAEWPPIASKPELNELSAQRNIDISIAGRTGPIKEFEEEFVKFMDGSIKYAITFNSGTSALLAAYIAVGISEDDEVIGPALTYHAALSPLHILRARVVLADVDLDTKCIQPEAIESLITPKTKAITVVHQWGHPADMDPVLKIAKKHKLKVIEDCSHAHGSKYKGRLVGSLGDVGVFSLQTNKTMFAGEGGVLVTNSREIHDRATLAGHYRDRSKQEINNPELHKYWVSGFGLKLRMSPFNAIVAHHSLINFPSIMNNRHRCLEYMSEQIEHKVPYLRAPVPSKEVFMGAWYGYKPIYLADKLSNVPINIFIEAAQAEGMQIKAPSGDILSSLPLYNQKHTALFPEYDRHVNGSDNLTNAKILDKTSLSFPTFSNWEQDKSIIDAYIEALEKIKVNEKKLVEYSQSHSRTILKRGNSS